jgi:hypothetical protein
MMKRGAILVACLSHFVTASGAFAVALGCLVIVAWLTHHPSLLPLRSESAVMQPNTAIGFLLTGIALIASSRAIWTVTFLCGGAAGLLGLTTLGKDIFSVDLGINQLLIGNQIAKVAAFTGPDRNPLAWRPWRRRWTS